MFGKVINWVKTHKTIFALIITSLFVLSQIPFVITHENWNDEAVSYGLSREFGFSSMFNANDSIPHPILWQLILMPFSKLGAPVEIVSYISLVFVTLAVFLFIRFAPMNYLTKAIFLASCALFYFVPIIAQDYSLIPLAIALLCIAYKNRHEKPLLYGLSLALLLQTHFLIYGFAIALAIIFLIETVFKKENAPKILKNLFLFLVPVALSLSTVIPAIINTYNGQSGITVNMIETDERLEAPFIQNMMVGFIGFYSESIWVLLTIVVGIFVVALLAKNARVALSFVVGLAFWFYIMNITYAGYGIIMPKIAILLLIALAVTWLSYQDSYEKENIVAKIINKSEIVKIAKSHNIKNFHVAIITVLAFVSIFATFDFAMDDYGHQFTNAKEIADTINSFEDGSLVIEADSSVFVEAIAREKVTKEVYYYNYPANKMDEISDYLKYDGHAVDEYKDIAMTVEDLDEVIRQATEQYEHVYFLTIPPSCQNEAGILSPTLKAYKYLDIVSDEEYYLDHGRERTGVFKIK